VSPSPANPLTGGCACGAVGFEVTAPFQTAGFCHCRRCQRRSGTVWTLNGQVPTEAFEIVRGADLVRVWTPDGGLPKAFCGVCGGHLYSDGGDLRGVRFGALDGDPGIRPRWHQWVESAPAWDRLPEDGLPRFPKRREL
jgi:hypothetical protein